MVVAEAVKKEDGKHSMINFADGEKRLGGIGSYISEKIMKKTDIEPDQVVECSRTLGSKFDKSYFPRQFNKIINEMRL